MNGNRTFVDTNVLVYAYDVSAARKRLEAREILADLWRSGLGVVSTQVLQEFFVTVTRKLPKAMDLTSAREVVSDLMKWDLVTVYGDLILEAIDLHKTHGYSFWDSLIISAAVDADCKVLLSEDLSSGDSIGTLTIVNPFV
jgi:predicted nucleic acid-binding protein